MRKKRLNPNIGKHGLIVLLLWAFAPGAWYLMYRDEHYHSWFPHLLWINGIVFGIVTLTFMANMSINLLLVSFCLVFPISQIVGGLILQRSLGKTKRIGKNLILPIILIFALDIVIGYLYVFL